ncbi:hypothetical protein [Ancylothrix sp. D3o]|uniref:hypothetical protein n=1 Tax=Ancylothrix sp. D3o TaxID=2953691 RepID=UPI0021BB63A6|nr:hypothetical protein [Ancylothrix sp. D3o]
MTNQGIAKTFLWPVWFPYPSSWLKSAGLCVLLTAVFYSIGIIASLNYQGFKSFSDNPELLTVLMILALLFPIPVIAFGQEIFQLFLKGFFKKIPPAQNQGLLPSLLSWWEGLYSWLVFLISSLIVTAFIEIILQLFNLNLSWLWEPSWLEIKVVLIGLFWVGVAAGFYQIEFLVKQFLIAGGVTEQKRLYSQHQEKEKVADSVTEPELEATSSKAEKLIPSPPAFRWRQFIWLFFQKAFIPLIIILGILRSYSSTQLTQITKGFDPMGMEVISGFPVSFPWFVSTTFFCPQTPEILTSKPTYTTFAKNPIISEAPLPVPYAPPLPGKPSKIKIEAPQVSLQIDPFQQAVYRATTAANLAKLAKTEDEWKGVSRQWQDAIKLMQAVPVESPQYKVAQTKVKEYEQNLIYAQKAGGVKVKDIGG